jgi:hypothetical protein
VLVLRPVLVLAPRPALVPVLALVPWLVLVLVPTQAPRPVQVPALARVPARVPVRAQAPAPTCRSCSHLTTPSPLAGTRAPTAQRCAQLLLLLPHALRHRQTQYSTEMGHHSGGFHDLFRLLIGSSVHSVALWCQRSARWACPLLCAAAHPNCSGTRIHFTNVLELNSPASAPALGLVNKGHNTL